MDDLIVVEKMVNQNEFCDYCGVRSVGTAIMLKYSLYFCSHHFRDYYDKLIEQGFDLFVWDTPENVALVKWWFETRI